MQAAERTVESEEPQHSSAARAILGDERLRVSLLRLVAFAVRLPAPDGEGAETLERQQQRAVGHAACRLAAAVLTDLAESDLASWHNFADALLRTQTLHAAARQLAACVAALEGGPAPPSPALCADASHCAAHTLNLLHKLARHNASSAFSARLVEDMKATQVLEHAARLLLILTPAPANASLQRSAALLAACYVKLLPSRNAAAAAVPGASAVTCTARSAPVPVARSAVAASSTAGGHGAQEAAAGPSGAASGTVAPEGASPSPSNPGRQMEHVAAGPCVQHAVFVFGLKALGELEAGAEERGGGPCPGCPGSRPAGQASGQDLSLLLHMLVLHLRGAASFSGTAGAGAGGGGWPRPRTAVQQYLSGLSGIQLCSYSGCFSGDA
ncbi:hypothetical protein HYH03_009931 [Edaphochlamys debaryana]|uniref:Uncharacterized protein n=1 Tax=Edaphochlamys debaryana TaxID=47281 RepID=A0A836BWR1_9CHLO|nr:hypothetical protein HYH03_009931 [Edaphochlamys debaryana]|eukprot:KAG2491770.1 hypothetical protein HYH03_009931 [Edaphochlamys debaryana]